MSELNDKLLEIKRQKDEYILPENIKKDVTVYGVTGTLEAGSGDVKLFDTVEHMQQDPSPSEGDLAIVYNNSFVGVQEDTIFNLIKFPQTVILGSAYTGEEIYCSFRSLNMEDFADLSASISSTNAEFRFYSNSLNFNITYTSIDGITYSCDRETTYSLGIDLKCDYDYNIIFSNFILCGTYNFGGIYRYDYYTDKDQIRFMPMTNLKYSIENNNITNFRFEGDMTSVYDYSKIRTILTNMENDGNYDGGKLFLDSNGNICSIVQFNTENNEPAGNGARNSVCYNNITHKYYMSCLDSSSDNPQYYYKIFTLDLQNLTYTLKETVNTFVFAETGSGVKYWYIDIDFATYPINTDFSYNEYKPYLDGGGYSVFYYKYADSLGSAYEYDLPENVFDIYNSYYTYLPAPTQFTATNNYVYNKQFLGKDGADIGMLGTNKLLRKTQFQDIITLWNKLLDVNLDRTYDNEGWLFQNNTDIITIPKFDTSTWTSLYGVFYGCTNLKTVPLLDTSNMTDIYAAFNGCANLESVPLFDFSKATRCDNVFSGCTKLTEVPNFDFSSATQIDRIFYGCTSLVTVPAFNSPNVSGGEIYLAFGNCPNLSDVSLNNILAWCISFENVYAGSRTLANLGLSQTQATKCTTLSNWGACQSAGWTTGY